MEHTRKFMKSKNKNDDFNNNIILRRVIVDTDIALRTENQTTANRIFNNNTIMPIHIIKWPDDDSAVTNTQQ